MCSSGTIGWQANPGCMRTMAEATRIYLETEMQHRIEEIDRLGQAPQGLAPPVNPPVQQVPPGQPLEFGCHQSQHDTDVVNQQVSLKDGSAQTSVPSTNVPLTSGFITWIPQSDRSQRSSKGWIGSNRRWHAKTFRCSRNILKKTWARAEIIHIFLQFVWIHDTSPNGGE